MKKLFAIFLALTFVFSLTAFTGDKPSAKASAGDPPDFSEGIEFTAFFTAYDALSELYESYFDYPEEYSDNFDFLMANVSRIMHVGGNFLSLMLYDTYTEGFHAAGNEGFFNIPFGFTKTKSGDAVTIAIDSAYKATPESSGVYTDGDHRTMTALLDKNQLTVSIHDSFSRDGEVYKRSVFEIVRLPDGGFLSQDLTVTKNLDWDHITSSAVFHRIDKDRYVMAIGEFEEPNVDFDYTSILDKVDRDPEQMAQNFKVTSIFKVENGEMTFESMR